MLYKKNWIKCSLKSSWYYTVNQTSNLVVFYRDCSIKFEKHVIYYASNWLLHIGDPVEGVSGRTVGLYQWCQQRPGGRDLHHRQPAERAVKSVSSLTPPIRHRSALKDFSWTLKVHLTPRRQSRYEILFWFSTFRSFPLVIFQTGCLSWFVLLKFLTSIMLRNEWFMDK